MIRKRDLFCLGGLGPRRVFLTTVCAAEAYGEGVHHELINRVNKLSCARDGGRPLGIGFQEQVSNHLQAAVVKSHGGERWRKSARKLVQVSIRETNESEPFEDASLKTQESSKPGAYCSPGTSPLDA